MEDGWRKPGDVVQETAGGCDQGHYAKQWKRTQAGGHEECFAGDRSQRQRPDLSQKEHPPHSSCERKSFEP
jgi:chitodextrinase